MKYIVTLPMIDFDGTMNTQKTMSAENQLKNATLIREVRKALAKEFNTKIHSVTGERFADHLDINIKPVRNGVISVTTSRPHADADNLTARAEDVIMTVIMEKL
ncbi:hypothetical protein XNMGNQLM_CDS0060 [Escherichia phage MIZ6]|uniref:Uncharacterized protein n=1 Tax=Escherichia phage kaaroe TaxID=2696412 RepID=A0A6B9WQY7_9CAUD|nr:hypothetical protein kaaroe_232 [Escherichia phage kaaroe]WMT11488.1 hypothetical protein XNMGNQLM_CDS0060 [Escherichia phage MIZ6]WNA14321.1 hypothetical protein SILIKYPJ_CDS0060 [Krischvirus RB49]WNA14589.1 hypothetical protein YCRUBIWT_CDS0060 [Krischvirus RB49]